MTPQNKVGPKSGEFKQGYYTPVNPDKCITRRCVYRSSYELKFFQWCDRSTNVVQWGSESVAIPYQSPIDKRSHKYYVDGYIKIRNRDGTFSKFLVEIKPERQTRAPVPSKRKKQKTILHENTAWIVNQAKWDAARAYCAKHGIGFIIMTEKHLQI